MKKLLGKIPVLGTVLGVAAIADAATSEPEDGKSKAEAVGGAAGGLVGGAAGAAGGAALGTMVLPGIGTAVGGLLGGALGGIGGEKVGQIVGDAASNSPTVQRVGEVIAPAADAAKDAAAALAETAKEGAAALGDAARNAAATAAEAAPESVKSGIRAVTSEPLRTWAKGKLGIRQKEKARAVDNALDFRGGKIAGLDETTQQQLIASTLATESNGGNYSVTERLTGGAIGAYQATPGWLADAGLMRGGASAVNAAMKRDGAKTVGAWMKSGGSKAYMADPNNWVEGMNQEKYLGSKEVQDTAFATVNNKVYQQLAKVDPATGKSLVDKTTPPEQVASLLKAAHVGGMRGARAVASGAIGAADHNGTSPQKYATDILKDAGGYRAAVEAAKRGRADAGAAEPGRPAVAATDPPTTATAIKQTDSMQAAAAMEAASARPGADPEAALPTVSAVPATAAPSWLVAAPIPASVSVTTATTPTPERTTPAINIPRPVANSQPEPPPAVAEPPRRLDSGGQRRPASVVVPATQNVSDRHIASVITGGIGAN